MYDAFMEYCPGLVKAPALPISSASLMTLPPFLKLRAGQFLLRETPPGNPQGKLIIFR